MPADLSPALTALWHDARGDWDSAHQAAQGDPSQEAAWAHAYLHRKEGDLSNAAYWYRRAGRDPVDSKLSFEQEWQEIASSLLGRTPLS